MKLGLLKDVNVRMCGFAKLSEEMIASLSRHKLFRPVVPLTVIIPNRFGECLLKYYIKIK